MNRLLTNQIFQILILLALLSTAVLFSFSDSRWRQQIRNFTFDNYNLFKPREASGDIIIVDIDEASIKQVGQMPWPRTIMADLVTNLNTLGAKAIVFDIVFPESDRSSPASFARSFKNMEGLETLQERLSRLPDNDLLFGAAIKDAGNVVTGFSFTNEQTMGTPRQIGIFRGKDIDKFTPNLRGVSENLRIITKFAAGNGSFFVSTDTDGIIRRVPMLVGHNKPGTSITSIYPSLSLETLRVIDKERGGHVILSNQKYAKLDPNRFGIIGVRVGRGEEGRFIPTNGRGEFLVYFAKSNPDWYIPAHTVLNKTIDPQTIKDKVVLIGTSAVGLKDIRSTPLDTFVPGVEVHLNIIDQILQSQFLKRSIEAEGIEAVTILAIGVVIILLSPFIGALTQAIVVTILMLASIYAGWYAFKTEGLLIDVIYPALSVLVIFTFSNILTYLRTETEKKQVREAFGLYISPDFMTELTKNPDKLKLGGEIRDLSIMFTDIRNFTSISEGLLPEELIQLMNDFLTPMSNLVMKNRGTIDKYMGDAMMAFWNAPLDDDRHAYHACITALQMKQALEPINKRLKENAEKDRKNPLKLTAGIGINTGPCAVGNMGSRQRFAYSALGDSVNLASRLEGQTKQYGVDILIGETTHQQAADLATLEIDLIRVIGKTQPVRIFALLGNEEMAKNERFIHWRETHEAMMTAYRNRDFDTAFKLADKCEMKEVSSITEVYEIYKERCITLMNNPPSDSWTGVYEATTK